MGPCARYVWEGVDIEILCFTAGTTLWPLLSLTPTLDREESLNRTRLTPLFSTRGAHFPVKTNAYFMAPGKKGEH